MTSLALLLFLQDGMGHARARLSAEGTLRLGSISYSLKEAEAALRKEAESGVRSLIVITEPSAPFSHVQSVMRAARDAGIDRVQFSSDGDEHPVRVSDAPRRSIRIKLKEGPKGLEVVLLRESTASSVDDLKKQLAGLEKGPVLIDADYEVPYGAVRRIVEACTQAGFEQVSFASSDRPRGPRLLYATRTENWHYRYVRNFLTRAADMRVDTHISGAGEFPADLSAYDAVLLGDLTDLPEPARKALVDYVRAGGGVLWTGPCEGWLGNALDSISPVAIVPSKDPETALKFSARGELLKSLKWDQMSGQLRSGFAVEKLHEGSTVQVESGAGPFVVTRAVGKGRSAYVGSDDTWRWRFQTGDEPHFAPFWLSVVRWTATRP
jgi:biopolymer transport protein ExbD